MPTVEVNAEIDIDEAQRALSDTLGADYKVTPASGDTLKVSRNFLLRGTVELRHVGGGTQFRISPFGLTLMLAVNSMVLVPKIRQAVEQAFPPRLRPSQVTAA